MPDQESPRPPMHFVALGFPDEALARAAERSLREHLDVGDADISADGLGGDPAAERGFTSVVAGRFREHRLWEVWRIARENDGEVIADVRETPEWHSAASDSDAHQVIRFPPRHDAP